MKRKFILIILVLLISTGLISLSKVLQNKETPNQETAINSSVQTVQQEAVSEEAKGEVKSTQNSSNNTTNDTQDSSNTKNDTQVSKSESTTKSSSETQKTTNSNSNQKPQPKAPPVQTPNFIITDSVNSKTIFSKAIEYNGETVAQATTKALDAAKISYKVVTFGDSVYFSSINGLRERSAGPSSGWCYYVNGKKLSEGAGSYKLNKNDKIEWKFLKDGVSIN